MDFEDATVPSKAVKLLESKMETFALRDDSMEEFHAGPDFKCETCDVEFRNKTSLINHIKMENHRDKEDQEQGVTSFKCNECPRVFALRSRHDQHVAMFHKFHKLARSNKCDYCPRAFFLHAALATHVEVAHPDKAAVSCQFCAAKFKSGRTLRTHLFTEHKSETSEKRFDCNDCTRSFARRSSLEMHIKTIHIASMPYECTLCHQKFGLAFMLADHIRLKHENNS